MKLENVAINDVLPVT